MSTREIVQSLNRIRSSRYRELFTDCGVALCCALLSCVSVDNSYSPFGVAAAVLDGKRGLFAVTGALVGYVVSYTPGSLLSCAALLLAFGIKSAVLLKSRRNGKRLAPLFCFLTAIAANTPRLFSAESLITEGISLVAQGLLTLGAALVLSRVTFHKESSEPQERLFLWMTIAAATVGLSCLAAWDFNLFRSVLAVFVLFFGLYGGETYGCAVGVVCGGLTALALKNPFFLLPFCLGGFSSGLLRRAGKAAAVTGMLVCVAASLAVCGINDVSLMFTLELLIGCAFLLVFPDRLWERIAEKVFPFTAVSFCDNRAAKRLSLAGKGLKEAADCVLAVSDKLKAVNAGNPAWVPEAAADAVCVSCGLKNSCWNEHYSDTVEQLSTTLPLFEKFGRIGKADFPVRFSSDCPKTAELSSAMNRLYGDYVQKQSTDKYAVQLRGMLAKQFAALATLTNELAGELSAVPSCDLLTAKKLSLLLENECLPVRECVCLLDSRQRMKIELTGPQELYEADWEKLLPRFFELTGRRFAFPLAEQTGFSFQLTLCERKEYRLEASADSLAANGETVSGDQRKMFEFEGVAYCLLSDGMGCGRAASVESKMTVSLTERLICAGFSAEAALSVVNFALMVKDGDERLATVDLLAVDLYSGNATFIKAGAAPSFLRRENEVKELSFPSRPIGILPETDVGAHSLRLSHGDTVLLVSDGALYDDNEWLRRELLSLGDGTAEIASSVLRRAKARRPSSEDDDITVLCARIIKNDVAR